MAKKQALPPSQKKIAKIIKDYRAWDSYADYRKWIAEGMPYNAKFERNKKWQEYKLKK